MSNEKLLKAGVFCAFAAFTGAGLAACGAETLGWFIGICATIIANAIIVLALLKKFFMKNKNKGDAEHYRGGGT